MIGARAKEGIDLIASKTAILTVEFVKKDQAGSSNVPYPVCFLELYQASSQARKDACKNRKKAA